MILILQKMQVPIGTGSGVCPSKSPLLASFNAVSVISIFVKERVPDDICEFTFKFNSSAFIYISDE